jgi:hypothetical protein
MALPFTSGASETRVAVVSVTSVPLPAGGLPERRIAMRAQVLLWRLLLWTYLYQNKIQ